MSDTMHARPPRQRRHELLAVGLHGRHEADLRDLRAAAYQVRHLAEKHDAVLTARLDRLTAAIDAELARRIR